MNSFYYDPIEWEYLVEPLKISEKFVSTIDTKTFKEFRIKRSDDYKIDCELYGNSDDTTNLKEKKTEPGEILDLINITCEDIAMRYELSYCYFVNTNFTYNKQNDKFDYISNLQISELKGYVNGKEEAKIHIEWYINAPKDHLIFTRRTDRDKKSIFTRSRETGLEETLERANSSGSNRDYILVNYLEKSFIIRLVPDKYKPDYSSKLAIEYRDDLGGIPEEDERISISQIVSFIFGKKLISIGYTRYNQNNYITEFCAINPKESNVIELCKEKERSPINISHHRGGENIEDVLALLVPRYIDLKNKLHLDYALWNYWVSKELPIGSNIPIMASGIETISQAWFKCNKNVNSTYMTYVEYLKISEEAIEILSTKLEGNCYKKRIINKVRNCHQMSGNERTNLFFDSIGLKIGRVEEEAIRARNPMIHGTRFIEEQKILKAIKDTKAFTTFFNKVILILLEYKGKYIDYSINGWPEKEIDQLLGSNIIIDVPE